MANFTFDVNGTIANNAVTNAKLADMAEARFKMRAAGAGSGDPIDGTADQATTLLKTATDPFARMSELPSVGITEVLTGLTLWVDSVNGNDGTAVSGDQAKQYLTLEAASNAAQAGDLVMVRPGIYTPVESIGKTGVNWHFDQGAIVNMSFDRFGIFDDRDGAIVCAVTGQGQFIRSGVPSANPTNIVRMVDAGSDIIFEYDLCDNQVNTESSAGNAAAIYHAAGKFTSRGRKLKAVFDTYYWIAGPGWLHVDEHTESGHHAVYCVVPDGNTDEVYFRCPKITANNQAIYTFRANPGDDGSAFRLWVVAESITGGRTALQMGPGKAYITAQKLAVSDGDIGNIITIGFKDGDQLFVNTQKIGLTDDVTSLGAAFALVVGSFSGGLARIACQEIDLSGVTTSAATSLIVVEGTDVDFELRDATFNAQAAIDCPIVANVAATGRRAFVNCRFTNVSPAPFVLTDDITVLQGCDIQTDATNSFTAVAAQTVVSLGSVIHDPLHANVTALGDLLYDTGVALTQNHVARVNANGTWSWAVTPGIVDGATLVTGLTFPNEGLKVKDTVGDNFLTIKPSVDMTGDRTLSLNVDANVSLQVTGNHTLGTGTTSGTNTGDQDLSGLQPLDADLTAYAGAADAAARRALIGAEDSAYTLRSTISGDFTTNSATFVDVTGLTVTIPANQTWVVMIDGSYQSTNTSTGVGVSLTRTGAPTRCNFERRIYTTATTNVMSGTVGNIDDVGPFNTTVDSANADRHWIMIGNVKTSGSSCVIQVRAGRGGSANNVSIMAGASIVAHRIA